MAILKELTYNKYLEPKDFRAEIKIRDEETNVVSMISWLRLEKELKKSGELKESEKITKVILSKDGINYYVVDK